MARAQADEPVQDGFTLQEYFLPGEGKRLRRLPELMRSAISIVWRAAPRDLVGCAVLQLVTGAAFAVQLLLMRTLLQDLLAQRTPEFSALVAELAGLAAQSGTAPG